MNIFLDIRATKEAVIKNLFYHAPGTNLGAIRYSMFSRKAAAGTIKPEALPPTEGARPLNSHCFTVRLKVIGQSSRSHVLSYNCEKGIFDSECYKAFLPYYRPMVIALFHDSPRFNNSIH